LLDHGRHPWQGLDDDSTQQAWRFRRRLGRCHQEADRQQLADDFPALAEAHGVHVGEPLRRFELEARLLAGQGDADIAARCGITAAGVGAYHSTFFECRPHLHADSYVVNVLIGPRAHCGLQPSDQEQLLKLAGFALGGPAVDEMLDFFAHPPAVPACFDGLDLDALRRLAGRLRTRLLVLALATPAAALPAEEWQRLGRQFALHRQADGGTADEAAALARIRTTSELIAALSRAAAGQPSVAVPA
jgi:hypothetical protein